MIAACDTFRAGAVEQLRTHTRKLNMIQNGKQMVQLFDKGYDKDAAFVAMSAIAHGESYIKFCHVNILLNFFATTISSFHINRYYALCSICCLYSHTMYVLHCRVEHSHIVIYFEQLLFILIARDMKVDVVLIDTAGRMQDNEPLMRSLAKVCIIQRNWVVTLIWQLWCNNILDIIWLLWNTIPRR